ncbi:MAG: helix-turn-helix transcriptional regulator [Povalibacter sp.]
MQRAVDNVTSLSPRTASADLLERFLRLTQTDVELPCMRVRVGATHTLKALDIDMPLLVLPLQGRKRVRRGDEWIRIVPGELLFFPRPTATDVENTPDPITQMYVAVGIPFEDHVLSAARSLLREPALDGEGDVASLPMQPHVADLSTWIDALERGDSPRACHALVGIALSFYAMGFRALLQPRVPSLSVRIRSMIASDPARPWSSEEIESTLALSGATLRRHLAAEGSTLRKVLADARLSHALNLLVTTQLPVKSVAQRVGYASVSTFIKRFNERYGVPPSQVGV